MKAATVQGNEFRGALSANAQRYGVQLSEAALQRLCAYYELLLTWNDRLHLVAPCSPSEFATRHVLESLLLLPHLRTNARVADIGSGAGLPIIPNLIVRPDIRVTLIEVSKKKSVFLREALRHTGTLEQAVVMMERFESVEPLDIEYVSCRALDRFGALIPTLIQWAPAQCQLLLFGGTGLRELIEHSALPYREFKIIDSTGRFLYIVSPVLR